MAQQTPTFTSWNNPDTTSGTSSAVAYGPTPVFRNAKDAQLSGYRSQPDTTYPDGYLGTMSANRRQDKILGTLSRMNARQYSRGVHKGERINQSDYLWPQEFNLFSALEAEQKGMRFAPAGAVPVQLTNDGKAGPRGIYRDQETNQPLDPARRAQLKSLAPRWR